MEYNKITVEKEVSGESTGISHDEKVELMMIAMFSMIKDLAKNLNILADNCSVLQKEILIIESRTARLDPIRRLRDMIPHDHGILQFKWYKNITDMEINSRNDRELFDFIAPLYMGWYHEIGRDARKNTIRISSQAAAAALKKYPDLVSYEPSSDDEMEETEIPDSLPGSKADLSEVLGAVTME